MKIVEHTDTQTNLTKRLVVNDAKLVIRIGLEPQMVCLESEVPDGAVIVSRKDSDVSFIRTWGHRGHVCHDGSHKIFSQKD